MLTVVYFSTTWCGPCKAFFPIVDNVTKTLKVPLTKFDAEANEDLAKRYSIVGVPTVLIIKEGAIAYRRTGVMPESELVKAIQAWK